MRKILILTILLFSCGVLTFMDERVNAKCSDAFGSEWKFLKYQATNQGYSTIVLCADGKGNFKSY